MLSFLCKYASSELLFKRFQTLGEMVFREKSLGCSPNQSNFDIFIFFLFSVQSAGKSGNTSNCFACFHSHFRSHLWSLCKFLFFSFCLWVMVWEWSPYLNIWSLVGGLLKKDYKMQPSKRCPGSRTWRFQKSIAKSRLCAFCLWIKCKLLPGTHL